MTHSAIAAIGTGGREVSPCPQPAEADIRPNGADSEFDPQQKSRRQFCRNAQQHIR
jgi:hypothetical protein